MQDYYFTESEDGYGRVFVPCRPWKPTFTDMVIKENISVVRLSASAGWRDSNLGFLKDLRKLSGIEVYSYDALDLSVLSLLHDLKLVCLQCEIKSAIDISGLQGIEVVKATWKRGLESILHCANLKVLNIVNWPYVDFLHLTEMSKIIRLFVVSRTLTSLKGIESLRELELLDIHRCSKLNSIDDLRHCVNIRHLEISSCNAIVDISPIGSIKKLTELYLDNDGDIASLTPIQQCKYLQYLSFVGSTKIVDGKISVVEGLTDLKALQFIPRRHYDRMRKDILCRIK